MATPSSVVVVWRTNGDIQPVVRFGTAPDQLDQVVCDDKIVERIAVDVAAAREEPYGLTPLLYDEPLAHGADRKLWDRNPSTAPGTRQFEASITGLEHATRYYYGVYDGEELLAGEDDQHYFVSGPRGRDPVSLRAWVVGDSGTGGADQHAVHEAMRSYSQSDGRYPDIFMHVGDMAYGDGADIEFQRNFFDVYQPTLRNTVCWPAMGNHEGHTSRGVSQFGPYYDAYVLPTRGEAGGAPSGTEAYYSFDIASAHIVCLDSHDLDRTPEGAMARWLEADLNQTRAEWLIAFWHHPPYTKGSHDSDREGQLREMRTHIMPLLEAGGVDLVLSGHSHIYERSMLIDGAYATPTVAEGVILDDGDGRPEGDGAYRKSRGLQPHNGTVAIVSGHGGAGLSRKGTMPVMREIIVEHGSCLIDIDDQELNAVMIGKRGEVLDSFQIVKQGVVEHTPIENPWTPPHDPDQITEMRIAWSEEEIGATPPDWECVEGSPEGFVIQKRPGLSFQHATAIAGESILIALYEDFDARLNEYEGWVEIPSASTGAAGVIFGWQDLDNYCCFYLDRNNSTATLTCVKNGEAHDSSVRELEIDFDNPIKFELEPIESIVEVQINDETEYTVNLNNPVPLGRIGVIVEPGGMLNVAGLAVEKAR